jgi:hypothetical protein
MTNEVATTQEGVTGWCALWLCGCVMMHILLRGPCPRAVGRRLRAV